MPEKGALVVNVGHEERLGQILAVAAGKVDPSRGDRVRVHLVRGRNRCDGVPDVRYLVPRQISGLLLTHNLVAAHLLSQHKLMLKPCGLLHLLEEIGHGWVRHLVAVMCGHKCSLVLV